MDAKALFLQTIQKRRQNIFSRWRTVGRRIR